MTSVNFRQVAPWPDASIIHSQAHIHAHSQVEGLEVGQRLYFGVRIYCDSSTLEGHPGRENHSMDSGVQLLYVIFAPPTCGEDNLSDWPPPPR